MNSQDQKKSSEVLAGGLEVVKNLSGAVSSFLAWVESEYPILPLNPAIGKHLLKVSALFAFLAGVIAHQIARRTKGIKPGVISFVLALVTLGAIFWLASGPSVLSPEANSLIVRYAYVLFFVFLGGTVGGILR
ncbi:MAG: hypothetical protein WA517_22670 [Candidatus Acidiferrum sp.]